MSDHEGNPGSNGVGSDKTAMAPVHAAAPDEATVMGAPATPVARPTPAAPSARTILKMMYCGLVGQGTNRMMPNRSNKEMLPTIRGT